MRYPCRESRFGPGATKCATQMLNCHGDTITERPSRPISFFFRNPMPETRNPKPETRNPRSEIRNPELEIRNPKPETRNPKPKTRNPEPEARNLQTLNPRPWVSSQVGFYDEPSLTLAEPCRGTSLIRKRHPPPRAIGIVLMQGPRGRVYL